MYWHQYVLVGFVISFLSESLVVYWLVKRKRSYINILSIVFLMHCFSHPFATILFYFFNLGFWVTELFVVIVEMLILKRYLFLNLRKAFIISLSANIFSILIGYLFRLLNFL